MGVELTSVIAILDVDLGLVDETSDQDVVGGLEVLDTLEGSGRHQTRAVTLLRAPCNFLALSVGDRGVGARGRPQAEV